MIGLGSLVLGAFPVPQGMWQHLWPLLTGCQQQSPRYHQRPRLHAADVLKVVKSSTIEDHRGQNNVRPAEVCVVGGAMASDLCVSLSQ